MASAQMLSRMLAAKATQGNQGRLYAEDAEEEEDVTALLLKKYIVRVDSSGCMCEDGPFVQVTKAGMFAVSFIQNYIRQSSILDYARQPAPAIGQMTVIDLLQQLKHKGWREVVLDHRKVCAPYKRGSEKLVYLCRGGVMVGEYLKALLSADRLVQKGGCVHYFQSKSYYTLH